MTLTTSVLGFLDPQRGFLNFAFVLSPLTCSCNVPCCSWLVLVASGDIAAFPETVYPKVG